MIQLHYMIALLSYNIAYIYIANEASLSRCRAFSRDESTNIIYNRMSTAVLRLTPETIPSLSRRRR